MQQSLGSCFQFPWLIPPLRRLNFKCWDTYGDAVGVIHFNQHQNQVICEFPGVCTSWCKTFFDQWSHQFAFDSVSRVSFRGYQRTCSTRLKVRIRRMKLQRPNRLLERLDSRRKLLVWCFPAISDTLVRHLRVIDEIMQLILRIRVVAPSRPCLWVDVATRTLCSKRSSNGNLEKSASSILFRCSSSGHTKK